MLKTEVLGRDLKMALMKVKEVGEAGVAGVVVVGWSEEGKRRKARKKKIREKKTMGHVESRAAGATSNGRGKG